MIDLIVLGTYLCCFAIGVLIGWSLHKVKLILQPGDKVHCAKCGAMVLEVHKPLSVKK